MAFTKDISNTSFELAFNFVNYTNASVFLTGKAGTGKTTFLKYVKENTIKNAAIVAPTGVAAINAGGTTIHSFFQLPFTPFIPVSKGYGANDNISDKHSLISRLRLNNERKDVMKNLELLIIDEISMVRCDVLDAIDAVLRHVRGQYTRPFGGVQLLFIGDMYQLPPVVKDEEWQLIAAYYKSPYFFNSHVIESQQPVYIELNKIYRQSDSAFVHVLNQVRNNELDQDGHMLLHSRYLPEFNPAKEENYITLTTHNNKADAINFKALNELTGTAQSFGALVEGEFYEKSYPADLNLQLKIGAQVMFIKNDTEKIRRYFNGKIGIINKIDDDKILIKCKDEPVSIEVRKEKWKNIRYEVDKTSKQIEETAIGSFTQFPLRLAWAITIHKSQGLTFERAIIDAGDAFAPGQVYVALSRCTSLDGMVLHSRISRQSLHSDKRIVEFAQTQHNSATQLQLLHNAQYDFQKATITSLFDFSEIVLAAKATLSFFSQQKTSFNIEAMNWVESLYQLLEKTEQVTTKFTAQQLHELLNLPDLPEQNEALQKRIIAAANHFYPALENIKHLFNNCTAITDNKTLATDCNKLLLDLYQLVGFRQLLFDACKNGFIVNAYLQQKRTFTKQNLPVNVYAGKSSYIKTDSPHPELYTRLRKKRDELCEKKNSPVYLVASSHTLDEMARYLPQTKNELIQISGFGKAKAEQFGESFLAIIHHFCEENNLQSNIAAKPEKEQRKKKSVEIKSDTKTASYLLYKEGKNLAGIAKERNMAVSTIEGHLAYFVGIGEIDINSLIPADKQKFIKDAIAKHGNESLKTIIENIPQGISYGEVRMVIAGLKTIQSP